jgi:uncharacterized protein (TIGR02118 family)
MIKVSVMYANEADGKFNFEYYRDHHMPLIKQRMGDTCLYYTIDKGLAGRGGSPAPFVAMCHIFSASLESFQAGFGPHADEIRADVANYTNIWPTTQISEVIFGPDGKAG